MGDNVTYLLTRAERESLFNRGYPVRRPLCRAPMQAGLTGDVLDFASRYLADVRANVARNDCGDLSE